LAGRKKGGGEKKRSLPIIGKGEMADKPMACFQGEKEGGEKKKQTERCARKKKKRRRGGGLLT